MRRALIATVATILLAPALASAAEPAGATISKKDDATWTGGPFAPNPIACATSVDPACDHFWLTVDAKAGTSVAVAITTAAPSENDFDLFVYAPDGTLLAQSATGSGAERVVFEHQAQYADQAYEVRVQPWLVAADATYEGAASTSKEDPHVVKECLQPVPEAISVDFADAVTLSVMVLRDGISAKRTDYLMQQAASSYATLNIPVEWRSKEVSFTTTDAGELIQAAKDYFGGSRPKGYDVVYVITDKDIHLGGNTAVAGLADCIGGVAYDDSAFAVGEDFGAATDGGRALGPFRHTVNGSAVVIAHEVGHLMGAHHHYGNCVQGNSLDEVLGNELTPCTLMFNAVNFASLPFSTVNTSVVRGHALEYARP